MKKILYITYDGLTDPLGQSQVLPYLEGLSKKGYKISLLSCEKPEKFTAKDALDKRCKEAGISWHPISYTRKPPIISTIKDIRRLKKNAASLHQENSFDLVHCRSYISALVGQWMKKKFKVPFIFDMRGFWADERVDGGLWSLQNPLYRTVYNYFKKKEKQFLEQASAVISLTHAAKKEIETWQLNMKAEITVIPCCVDTVLFNPKNLDDQKRLMFREKANIPYGEKVLGYVGSLGTWYLLPEMMRFYKVWVQQYPDSILFFVTTEPGEIILQEAAVQGISKKNIRIVSASRSEVPYYISLMNYGLFFLKQAFSKMASSPVKQGELMAMGVPIICNAGVGDTDMIVKKYNAGVLIKEYTKKTFEETVSQLSQTVFDVEAIQAGCFEYFDLGRGIEQYAAVYKNV